MLINERNEKAQRAEIMVTQINVWMNLSPGGATLLLNCQELLQSTKMPPRWGLIYALDQFNYYRNIAPLGL